MDERQKVLVLGAVGVGVLCLSGGLRAGQVKKATGTPSTGGTGSSGSSGGTGGGGWFTLPGLPGGGKAPAPAPAPRPSPSPSPSPAPSPSPSPSPAPIPTNPPGSTHVNALIPAGPAFGQWRPALVPYNASMESNLVYFVHAQTSWLSILAAPRVARALVKVAREESYPLDLLIGHAWAENALKADMHPNGAGAIGPLQVTRSACAAVGMAYPPANLEDAVRVGVRYMKHLRRSYPEARSSITACLRMYGMGPGKYRSWIQGGRCLPCSQETSSVAKAECYCADRQYPTYTEKVFNMAKKAAKYHTVDWSSW